MISNMVSNLESARQAIEAELSHAKQGMAYYMSRVEALEIALQQLENVEDEWSIASQEDKSRTNTKSTATNGRKRGRKARAAAQVDDKSSRRASNGARRGRKPRSASAEEHGLPSTGGDFWLQLVSDQPRSAVDISNAAINVLGITPDQKEQIQKLKQRVSPALAGLVAAQKIKDTGSGRERRFFKG